MDNAWIWNLLGLLSIPALAVLNGLFVVAEFSLAIVRKTQIEEMVRQGVSQAKALEEARRRLDRSLAATQLGITVAGIAVGWVAEPALARLLYPLFAALPGAWSTAAAHSAATVVAFLAVTFVLIVFGELIPRSLALQAPANTALWLAAPLVTFSKVTRPLTILMSAAANAVVRLFGYEPVPTEGMVHSVDELGLLIEDSEEAGLLAPEQAEYVQNVFRLSTKQVSDCLVPRERMAALELTTPPEKILEAVHSGAHTRMPVYEGNLDNIVGIVNTKDLFYVFSLKGVVILQDAMYPAIFLKPDASMTEALRLFRRSHRPMALVRDDAGKIHGLITLEDILEEIVGDIEDEHDRPTPKLRVRRPKALTRPFIPTRK